MKTTLRRCASAAALTLLTLAQIPVWADPPGQAPAHGWRKKHDPYYLGYAGKKWNEDYGITAGRCNRQAVGAVLGGVMGGVVGAQVGEGSGKRIAILVGSAVGAVLGAQIGRDLDAADAACIGHALELARDGRRVSWHDDAGTHYQLQPLAGFSQDGLPCRRFELVVGGKALRQAACQREPGVWEMR